MDILALFDMRYLAAAVVCLVIAVAGAIWIDIQSRRRKAIVDRAAERDELTDKEQEILGAEFAFSFLGIGMIVLVAGAAAVESVCRSLGGTCVLTWLR